MLKHIIQWKFKDTAEGSTKAENLQKAKSLLDRLPSVIKEIQEYEVGIDILHTGTSNDLVLVSSFENTDTLRTYQKHPEHVKVAEFLSKVQTAKVVVDYVV